MEVVFHVTYGGEECFCLDKPLFERMLKEAFGGVGIDHAWKAWEEGSGIALARRCAKLEPTRCLPWYWIVILAGESSILQGSWGCRVGQGDGVGLGLKEGGHVL